MKIDKDMLRAIGATLYAIVAAEIHRAGDLTSRIFYAVSFVALGFYALIWYRDPTLSERLQIFDIDAHSDIKLLLADAAERAKRLFMPSRQRRYAGAAALLVVAAAIVFTPGWYWTWYMWGAGLVLALLECADGLARRRVTPRNLFESVKPQRAFSSIPWYWWPLVIAASASPLYFMHVHWAAPAAIITAVIALACGLVGWNIATEPEYHHHSKDAIDRYIEELQRRQYAASSLSLSYFVVALFALLMSHAKLSYYGLATAGIWIVFSVWAELRNRRSPPSANQFKWLEAPKL